MQQSLAFRPERIADNFCGGGGASTGIRLALGRDPDYAINHDPEAIAIHSANHPGSMHFCQDVWKFNPADITEPVGLAWFSPDCKHFSKAKGGKPVEKKIRDLAWVVVRWAQTVRPRVILLENVEEFQDWGPLITGPDGKAYPDPARKGLTFRRWLRELKRAGYVVDWRELRACDFGAPTIRKRFYLVARRDGLPIVWPKPTHAKPSEAKRRRLKPYRTAAECVDWSIPAKSIFDRDKPLVDATLRRIAHGVFRFVIDAEHPYIVPAEQLAAPVFINTRNGERPGQTPRARDILEPYPTVTAHGSQGALAMAYLAATSGPTYSQKPRPIDAPLHTITADSRAGLVAAFLEQANTGMVGHDARKPLSTIVGSGTQQRLVTLELSAEQREGAERVYAFLMQYYGQGGSQTRSLHDPAPTVVTKDRLALVLVQGVPHAITDIRLRPFSPRELYLMQGFPRDYIIDPMVNGKRLSRTAQIRMCGNSVSPPVAQALAGANFKHEQQFMERRIA